jgi:hypothetical protein
MLPLVPTRQPALTACRATTLRFSDKKLTML